MRSLLLTAALLSTPILVGCSSEATTTASELSQTVSAGCGSCTYHLADAEGCPLAVEIRGTPMLVTGSDFNAMDNGLCAEKKQVTITGEVQGNRFAATSVTLAE